MERRDFLQGAGAGALLGGLPLASAAAALIPGLAASATPGAPVPEDRPLLLVQQADVPQAAALIRNLGSTLAQADRPTTTVRLDADALRDFSRIADLLDQWPQARVLGVLDDASAILFQEIATARGATCGFQSHHRFASDRVRLVSFLIHT